MRTWFWELACIYFIKEKIQTEQSFALCVLPLGKSSYSIYSFRYKFAEKEELNWINQFLSCFDMQIMKKIPSGEYFQEMFIQSSYWSHFTFACHQQENWFAKFHLNRRIVIVVFFVPFTMILFSKCSSHWFLLCPTNS